MLNDICCICCMIFVDYVVRYMLYMLYATCCRCCIYWICCVLFIECCLLCMMFMCYVVWYMLYMLYDICCICCMQLVDYFVYVEFCMLFMLCCRPDGIKSHRDTITPLLALRRTNVYAQTLQHIHSSPSPPLYCIFLIVIFSVIGFSARVKN